MHGYKRAGLADVAPSNPPIAHTGYVTACRLGNLAKMWKSQTGKVAHQNSQWDMESKEGWMIRVKGVRKGGNTGSQVGLPTGYILTLTLFNWHTDG